MCVHAEAKRTLLRNPPIGLRVSAKGVWILRLGFMVYDSEFGAWSMIQSLDFRFWLSGLGLEIRVQTLR